MGHHNVIIAIPIAYLVNYETVQYYLLNSADEI